MLQFSHGAVQWLTTQTAGTIIPVTGSTFSSGSSTGQAFEPKAIRFYYTGIQSTSDTQSQIVHERRGVGFVANGSVTASGVSQSYAVGTYSGDASGSAVCAAGTLRCAVLHNASNQAGTITYSQSLSVSSFTSDGFTLSVNNQLGTGVNLGNMTVFWEAWGGDEISNVTVGTISEPAATGTQTYTATGFVASPATNDQCVMFAGQQGIISGSTVVDSSTLHVGFSTSTSTANNITVMGSSDNGSATMDTDGYNYTGECVSMITPRGAATTDANATLSAYGAGTFTLNWTNRSVTNRVSAYMAIKGGEWFAGSTTINGNTLNSTATIGGFPINIRGISLIGAGKTISTQGSTTTNDRMAFGSGISTTFRNSTGILDENGTANSELDHAISYTAVLVYPSITGTLQTQFDINALGANSVQLITDVAGGVASEWIGYLVFGDRKPRTVSIGHPFIG